jgi:hypothetical protein
MALRREGVFDSVSVYITDRGPQVPAAVSFHRVAFGAFGYIREHAATGSNPFTDDSGITPLSDPYICQNGHHLFSLAYYTDITQLEIFHRICFNDKGQDINIALNFPSDEDFRACIEFLRSEITFGPKGIKRLRRPLSTDHRYTPLIGRRRTLLTQNAVGTQDGLMKEYTALWTRISLAVSSTAASPKKSAPTASAESIAEAFQSRHAMRELLLSSRVEDQLKWRVWLFMLGLYPTDTLNESFSSQYLNVRTLWYSITRSQAKRSQRLGTGLSAVVAFLENHRNDLLCVVADPAVLAVIRSVLLSIVYLFWSIADHLDAVLAILKVLLWLFVTRVENGDHFVNPEGDIFDSEKLEILLFWSLLYVLEIGETRVNLQNSDSRLAGDDFIIIVQYGFAALIQPKGGYEQLRPIVATHLATMLPPSKCMDVWLTAVATPSFAEFTEFMVVTAVLLSFGALLASPPNPLETFVRPTFACVGLDYLRAVAFFFQSNAREMVEERLDK